VITVQTGSIAYRKFELTLKDINELKSIGDSLVIVNSTAGVKEIKTAYKESGS
jgi:hypothetical protein